jgi:hypothetical protein
MFINLISLTQIILVTIFSAFSGNLFSIFIDRRFFSELSKTPNKPEVLEAILAGLFHSKKRCDMFEAKLTFTLRLSHVVKSSVPI